MLEDTTTFKQIYQKNVVKSTTILLIVVIVSGLLMLLLLPFLPERDPQPQNWLETINSLVVLVCAFSFVGLVTILIITGITEYYYRKLSLEEL